MTVVFGLGSGRCGTKSLASLINTQPGAVCFHEVNPSCMSWEGTEHSVLALLQNFRAALEGRERAVCIDYTGPHRDGPLEKYITSQHLALVGDVGFYYLPYVEYVLSHDADARFPCLQRERTETIDSFITKLTEPRVQWKRKALIHWIDRQLTGNRVREYRNHWAPRDDTRWKRDPKWDKCFPVLEHTETLREAVDTWYEMYYVEVNRLRERYPKNVEVFDMSELNTEEGQQRILGFCGIEKSEMVFAQIRENQTV